MIVCRTMGMAHLKVIIYTTVILPVVLYGCGAWSVTFREEHRLRMLEMIVLRRMLGPKRQEVLYTEELCDLYCLPYIISVTRSRRIRVFRGRVT